MKYVKLQLLMLLLITISIQAKDFSVSLDSGIPITAVKLGINKNINNGDQISFGYGKPFDIGSESDMEDAMISFSYRLGLNSTLNVYGTTAWFIEPEINYIRFAEGSDIYIGLFSVSLGREYELDDNVSLSFKIGYFAQFYERKDSGVNEDLKNIWPYLNLKLNFYFD